MGAFDTYAATARCPRCDDLHAVSGQTKFFEPDFGELCNRDFVPGKAQPLYFGGEDLASERVWGEWWRVRELVAVDELDLLADYDELFGCDCGAGFAVVLRFVLTEGMEPTGTLREIDLREVEDERATDVDFAAVPPDPWNRELAASDLQAYLDGPEALAARPPAERQALVRALLRERFAVAAAGEAHEPWTWISGEVRCESCGELRPRRELSLLTHRDHAVGFFGPAWTGGAIGPGTRIDCDLAWLGEDVDRGYHVRLRHPVPADRLTVLLRRRAQGCRCGAGLGALVLYFERDAAGLALKRLGLRLVRAAEDLADIDFAEAPYGTRERDPNAFPMLGPWSREAALEHVLAELA